MIVFGPHQTEWMPFNYIKTERSCPECGHYLTKVDASTMLVCDKGHGPYFLV